MTTPTPLSEAIERARTMAYALREFLGAIPEPPDAITYECGVNLLNYLQDNVRPSIKPFADTIETILTAAQITEAMERELSELTILVSSLQQHCLTNAEIVRNISAERDTLQSQLISLSNATARLYADTANLNAGGVVESSRLLVKATLDKIKGKA